MPEVERRFVPLSDGYPAHVTTWRPDGPIEGQVVILHGVQSHAGWYERLGKTLAEGGWLAVFPDRRGSGANVQDRGHTKSARRLYADVAERLSAVRAENPGIPTVLAGISWGGKLAVVTAARRPELVDAAALICPGLEPRVGVSRSERRRIFLAWVREMLGGKRKYFPIPLADPALFTNTPERQRFIAADPLGLREASGSMLAASRIIDLGVRLSPRKVTVPILLMLAEHDRIVDNEKTRRYFDRVASTSKRTIEYPGAHHTLEFEPEPDRHARDLLDWMREATRKN
jgi:alpha-beta hydrolase superfamily lysophospholipase